jgi:exopolysaccharide production protein ExoZ
MAAAQTDTEGRPPGADPDTPWVRPFAGVRGYVSLSILLYHVQFAIDWRPGHEFPLALRSAWFLSIEMLFLLGGFVALLPALQYGRFPGVRWYLIRRAGRLLPVYWLTIGLAVILGALLRPVAGPVDTPHDAVAVLTHLVFLQQIVYPFQAGFGVQGIVWTMTIVACFYVLFAFTADWYVRHPLAGLGIALGTSVLWRTQVPVGPDWYVQFPLFLSDFAIGMTAAWVYTRVLKSRRKPDPGVAVALATLSLATFVVLWYATGLRISRGESLRYDEGVFLALAIPSAFACFLVALPFAPRWFQWPVVNRAASWLGDVSYALFLFHFLVIWTVLRFTDIPQNGSHQSLIELTLLVFPLTATLAWLGTKYVETPIRLFAQRLAEPFAAKPAPATAADVAPVPA